MTTTERDMRGMSGARADRFEGGIGMCHFHPGCQWLPPCTCCRTLASRAVLPRGMTMFWLLRVTSQCLIPMEWKFRLVSITTFLLCSEMLHLWPAAFGSRTLIIRHKIQQRTINMKQVICQPTSAVFFGVLWQWVGYAAKGHLEAVWII